MGSWVPGALLLAGGVAWIALRVTIERKAVTGSWVSHLIRELAVIRQLPVIGLVWRLLPLLLITAGILWLSGVRPPGMGDGGEASRPSSHCAVPSHRPASVPAASWSDYRCESQSQAGDRWSQCLSRSAYTEAPGRGCPGAERCCPAP